MQNQLDEMYCAARRFARRYGTIGVSDYEDIALAAMIKMISREEMPCSTVWMFKTVRSVAADFGRQVTSERRKFSMVAEGIVEATSYPRSEVEIDLMPQLKKVLSGLRQPLREALLLHAEGYSYEEIAVIVGTNIGTVRSRIYYARKRAQAQLVDVA